MKASARQYGAYAGAWAARREGGFAAPVGAGDAFAKSLYSSMSLCAQWDALKDSEGLMHGGIFNLEFSPDGSMLVAACEKNSIMIVDPLTYKKVHYVDDAHTDCVNFVKFLDARVFATCSDDTTVALWDARNPAKPLRTLRGHSNWVKNVEYSVKDKLLVTSGLDGSIYAWDIDSRTEWSFVYRRVFHAPGLMRCRISPDATQLVMCTTGGLLIVVHRLDLATLAADLHGFKPNMYRLMQMTNQPFPLASAYDRLFDSHRTRNRVEFVSDFPKNDDAEVVSSLQIHPHGWCALSRNVGHDDRSEWTCVHDIQERDDAPDEEEAAAAAEAERPPTPLVRRTTRYADRVAARTARPSRRSAPAERPARRSAPAASPQAPTAAGPVPSRSGSSAMGPNDIWEAQISVRQQRIRIDLSIRGEQHRSFNLQRIQGISSGITVPPEGNAEGDNSSSSNGQASTSRDDRSAPGSSTSAQNNSPEEQSSRPKKEILQNKKRLLYYIQEPNVGQGFIKELCFSADGRLVCSPYGYGVRLLSFNENCSELPYCVPKPGNPVPLTELWKSVYHDDYVVTAKFSPRHFMLATGCLSGRIIWYQPRA